MSVFWNARTMLWVFGTSSLYKARGGYVFLSLLKCYRHSALGGQISQPPEAKLNKRCYTLRAHWCEIQQYCWFSNIGLGRQVGTSPDNISSSPPPLPPWFTFFYLDSAWESYICPLQNHPYRIKMPCKYIGISIVD